MDGSDRIRLDRSECLGVGADGADIRRSSSATGGANRAAISGSCRSRAMTTISKRSIAVRRSGSSAASRVRTTAGSVFQSSPTIRRSQRSCRARTWRSRGRIARTSRGSRKLHTSGRRDDCHRRDAEDDPGRGVADEVERRNVREVRDQDDDSRETDSVRIGPQRSRDDARRVHVVVSAGGRRFSRHSGCIVIGGRDN